MSPTVVFETPGLIDLRSFTMMGVSAKPNSDRPIGQFGTGLKYAIAVLVRMGAEPVVWIGRDKYTFSKKGANFRGKEISLIRMKSEKFHWTKPRWTELPFTTDYGRFWELWQVYRELEANTRDEGGESYQSDNPPARAPDRTYIEITHEEFFDTYLKRDEVFLPGASSLIKGDEILEVFEAESQYLYYRGMRIHELSKPSQRTYNIIRNVELTEDRTLKYEFQARQALGDFVFKSSNREFVELVVTAPDDRWESEVEYDSWQRPKQGRVFQEIIRAKPENLRRSAEQALEDEVEESEELDEKIERNPLPWRVISDWIEDANGDNVCQKPVKYRGDWSVVAERIVEEINRQSPSPPVELSTNLESSDVKGVEIDDSVPF